MLIVHDGVAPALRRSREKRCEQLFRSKLAEGDFRVSSKKWRWKSFRAHIRMLCSRTADYWEYFLSFHKFANAIDANVDMTEAAAVDWIFRRSNGSSVVLINDRGSRLRSTNAVK